MDGSIPFSLGLMMLALVLSCDAVCQEALGMENGAIPDGQITASSKWNGNHGPDRARLNIKEVSSRGKQGAWVAKIKDVNQWLQIDLGDPLTKVVGLATQGRNGDNDWVKRYRLQYSNDGVNFQYYTLYIIQGQSTIREFLGNTDRDTIVFQELNPPIRARYIRFRPTAWYRHIGMRVELYGCKACPDDSPYAFDECGQRCTCIDGRLSNCSDVRIRKEFTTMTPEERERYISTVIKASTDPKFKPDYESLLETHRTLFSTDIHQKKHFLTWHRWFTLQYENLLRRVDCSVNVPYWDWSSSNPFDTSSDGVWNSADFGFGGNGTGDSSCVQTGPFREGEWSLVPPQTDTRFDNKICLARHFGTTPTKEDVADLLCTPAANFTDFELELRNVLHFNVHLGVGGTMFTDNSAAAPEFFLVHSFVDKIWDDWQKKSCAHKYAFFLTVDEVMPYTQIRPHEVIDLSSLPGDVQVEYESNAVKRRRGQSSSERPRISRGLDPKIIKLFNISPAEVEKAKAKEQLVQQMPRISRGLDGKIIKLFNVSPAEVEKAKEMEELVQPRNNAYDYN